MRAAKFIGAIGLLLAAAIVLAGIILFQSSRLLRAGALLGLLGFIGIGAALEWAWRSMWLTQKNS